MTVTRHQLAEIEASMRHLLDMLDNRQNLVLQRWRDWTDTAIRAVAYSDRTSPANRVADINGERAVVPNLSDPVGESATSRRQPETPDYDAVVRTFISAARDLERVVADSVRDSTPDALALKATDTADKIRPGAGTCVVCGHECTGLTIPQPSGRRREDRAKPVNGWAHVGVFCPTHHQGAHRSLRGGSNPERYAESERARLLDMSKIIPQTP